MSLGGAQRAGPAVHHLRRLLLQVRRQNADACAGSTTLAANPTICVRNLHSSQVALGQASLRACPSNVNKVRSRIALTAALRVALSNADICRVSHGMPNPPSEPIFTEPIVLPTLRTPELTRMTLDDLDLELPDELAANQHLEKTVCPWSCCATCRPSELQRGCRLIKLTLRARTAAFNDCCLSSGGCVTLSRRSTDV